MTKYLACLLLASACGARDTAATSTPTERDNASLPDLPFDELDQDQRMEFMKQRVMPRMSPIFAQRDPERFAEIGCRTCHGKQADEGHFDMPSTHLPTLDLDDLHTWKPRDLAWMRNEVAPTMAALLSRTQGFGCGNCHITE